MRLLFQVQRGDRLIGDDQHALARNVLPQELGVGDGFVQQAVTDVYRI